MTSNDFDAPDVKTYKFYKPVPSTVSSFENFPNLSTTMGKSDIKSAKKPKEKKPKENTPIKNAIQSAKNYITKTGKKKTNIYNLDEPIEQINPMFQNQKAQSTDLSDFNLDF
jgi:hypothetical protein